MLQNWGKNETSIWAAGTHADLLLGFLCSISTKRSEEQEQSCKLAAPTGPMLLSAVVDPIQTRTTILFMTLVS